MEERNTSAIYTWNCLQIIKNTFFFHQLSPNKLRNVIQLQIILAQLTPATLDSPMQGFMQFTQHNYLQ